jgi:ATP-dependent DNA helicase RecG
MIEYTAQELFEILNESDECDWIEAKGGHERSHSVMETVCSFSNEPGLGGGYILMGVAEEDENDELRYKAISIGDPDKAQKDFATQCASMFNLPVRPSVKIEEINGKTVIKIRVHELPDKQKPLFFKPDGLPEGAWRRIGSTDQRCTEDDMHVFYQDSASYDQTSVKGTSVADVDENALKRYRVLREKVNPAAEELTYNDGELLEALGCVNKENPDELNISGLLIFGNSKIQRSTFPMLRVDYIRVQGNTWVPNPDERFTTIDMRGPLILMLYRLIDAINADLPKGFLLTDDNLQATSTGLPMKALREAIVNALMHRSYREHRPTQIIRYDNRIEIINPGFSLKPEDKLGQPGSETRNPFIAAVFHDTNLAETKGSGIRAMRRLLASAHLAPPTFESSRENNEFVTRLLLHHFLNAADLEWLRQYDSFELSDSQKQALIFVREVGAIDNSTYRQMADCDLIKAGSDLKALKDKHLLTKKGRAKATYYIPGKGLSTQANAVSTQAGTLSTQAHELNTEAGALNAEAGALSTETGALSTEASALKGEASVISKVDLLSELSDGLISRIKSIKQREKDKDKIKEIIKDVCRKRHYTLVELSMVFDRTIKYLSREFIKPMIDSGEMKYKYPEMLKHPEQAYITAKKK